MKLRIFIVLIGTILGLSAFSISINAYQVNQYCYIDDISDIKFYHLAGIDLEKQKKVDEFLDNFYDKISMYPEVDQLRYYSTLNEKILLGKFLERHDGNHI